MEESLRNGFGGDLSRVSEPYAYNLLLLLPVQPGDSVGYVCVVDLGFLGRVRTSGVRRSYDGV